MVGSSRGTTGGARRSIAHGRCLLVGVLLSAMATPLASLVVEARPAAAVTAVFPAAATVSAGTSPAAIAVNDATNKIYVANAGGGATGVTVIDGANNGTTSVTTGTNPHAVAVNPVTNRIYVANVGSNNVTVIDGSTDAVTATVTTGVSPVAVAVNPVTNKIYVADQGDDTVTVIDGTNNTKVSVPVGVAATDAPVALAVNPVTNKIYVAAFGGGDVYIINGADNTSTSVPSGNIENSGPFAVAVNPVTNKAYVANRFDSSVTVIDGAGGTTTVATGANPWSVAVNPLTNLAYVANNSGTVTVIDGSNNPTPVTVGTNPVAVAVNVVNNKIYVANNGGASVTLIDGATKATTSVTAGTGPSALAVNSTTNKIYAANAGTNNVTVIDGATNGTASVTAGNNAKAVAVNAVTNKAYVANIGNPGTDNGNVTVIDGNNSPTAVTAGMNPDAVAINPITDRIYVPNGVGGDVTVIDGSSDTVAATVPAGGDPDAVAVNPVTNKVYVANNDSGDVTVIDGATNTVAATVPAGLHPRAVAVNPVTNKIYVANNGTPGTDSGNVTVIDGDTNTAATVTGPSASDNPTAVAVNPLTNKAYVANANSSNVTVIDGANQTTNVATDFGPTALDVNPVTNKIYVATLNDSVTTIKGADNSTTSTALTPPSPYLPLSIAVNPVTDKVYVPSAVAPALTIIDGSSGAKRQVFEGNSADAVAVNPVTNRAYVAASTNSVVTEQSVQPIPLETAITPLAGNSTSSSTPTFSLSAISAFLPTATAVDGVRFQVDTWQGQWTAATSTGGGNFSAKTSTLGAGVHTLYAYATDGQDATSTQTGSQSSPLNGAITAYTFLVTVPPAPAGLAAVGVSASEIDLSWNPVGGATSYKLYRAASAGGPYSPLVTVTTTSYANKGLASGATYFYEVRDTTAQGVSPNSAPVSATTLTLPATPTGLAATGVSSSEVDLSWNSVTEAASYKVFRATSLGGPYSPLVTVTGNTYANKALPSGATYFYEVRSQNTAGVSPNSAPVSGMTLSLPATPAGVTATGVSPSEIDLSWGAVAEATSYKLYRATSAGGPYSPVVTVTGTSYANKRLAAGASYFYEVRAQNAAGVSPNSAPVSATTATATTAPSTPTGLQASAPGPGVIILTWDNTPGANSYIVLRSTTPGQGYVQVGTPSSNITLDTDVTSGTTYYYVIRAVGDGGTSGTTAEVSATAS